jgi:DNA gyrase/topoisomerase IV subunit A
MGTTTAMSARSLQYYVIATRWAAELEFFNLETPFLYYLVEEYFIRLCEPARIKKFMRVRDELSRLEIDKKKIDSMLTHQIKMITLMSEDIVPEDIDSLSEKQIQLEYLVNGMTMKYRVIKKELFELTDTFRKSKSN